MAANTELTTQQARVNKGRSRHRRKNGGLAAKPKPTNTPRTSNNATSKPQSDDWKTTSPQTAAEIRADVAGPTQNSQATSNAKENSMSTLSKHRQNRRCRRNKIKAFSSSLLILPNRQKGLTKSLTTYSSTEKKSPVENTLQPRHLAEAKRTGQANDEPSMTQQHGKEEADINTIVNRFLKTGILRSAIAA